MDGYNELMRTEHPDIQSSAGYHGECRWYDDAVIELRDYMIALGSVVRPNGTTSKTKKKI